jgi:hypothetical protein
MKAVIGSDLVARTRGGGVLVANSAIVVPNRAVPTLQRHLSFCCFIEVPA